MARLRSGFGGKPVEQSHEFSVAPGDSARDFGHVVRMLARLPWAWEIEAHVDAPLEELTARVPATLAELSADGGGTRLMMRADSLAWAAGVLAGLGADFHIVRPDELRDHVAQLAARLSSAASAVRPRGVNPPTKEETP